MKIADLLSRGNVVLDVPVADKPALLGLLADRAQVAHGLDRRKVLAALQGREDLGSTGIGGGIAIPHAAVPGLPEPFALFVRLPRPIDFGSVDDVGVDIVFMLLTPHAGQPTAGLNALASVARQLRSRDVVARLRAAHDADAAFAALNVAV